MVPRDADLVQIIGDLSDRLKALEANTVSRWGRVPHVAADPATLADGMDWIRSDTGEWRYRANGATVALDARYASAIAPNAFLDARYVPLAGGVVLADAAQTLTTGTITAITWSNAEISDPDNWATVGSATLTVPTGKGGRYLLAFTGTWNLGPLAHSVLLSINGATVIEAFNSSGGTVLASSMFTTLRTLVAGDQLVFSVVQASGGNRDITSRLEIAPV